MSKNTPIARHRAVPVRTNPLATASRAITTGAAVAGKPAAVVVAASGILLGAALPASASGEISTASVGTPAVGSPAVTTPAVTAAPAVEAPGSAPSAAGTYVVRSGDTLSGIAASQSVSLDALFAANGLGYSSVIHPGQTIVLPGAAHTPQAAPVAAPSAAPASTPAAPGNSTGLSTQSAASIAPAATGATSGIAATALSGQGSAYVYGGTSFGAWDCSGFVQWVYAQHGIQLPRVTTAQVASLRATSNPQPGDVVSQNGGSHVGIYLGNGQMISALNPSQGTQIHPVSAMSVDGYYTR